MPCGVDATAPKREDDHMTSDAEHTDILIVGAGPAGLMAATVAVGAGALVTLVEVEDRLGGRLALQTQPLQGPASIYQGRNGVEFCRRLADDAVSAGARILPGVTVSKIRGLTGRAAPYRFELTLCSADFTLLADVWARTLIVAAGSTEPWHDAPGVELRGVARCGEVQAELNLKGILPGKRALIVGSDNAELLIAANLLEAGVEVAAVIDESSRVVGREFNAAPLRDAGVQLLTSSRLIEAHGDAMVESVTIEVAGERRTLEVDALCIGGPRFPHLEMSALAGLPMLVLPALGGSVPFHDSRMATPIAGIYVCGDASGVESGAVAMENGRLAGVWAAAEARFAHPQGDALLKLARRRLAYLRRGPRGRARREAKARAARWPD